MFEQVGKPRLYQFFDDRSLGWICRYRLKVIDKMRPLTSITNIERDERGRAIRFTSRKTRFVVNCKDYKFAHLLDVASDGTSRADICEDGSGRLSLYVWPDDAYIDRKTFPADEYWTIEPTHEVTLDLFMKRAK